MRVCFVLDNKEKTNKVAGSCPTEPPKDLVDAYTMGGKIGASVYSLSDSQALLSHFCAINVNLKNALKAPK